MENGTLSTKTELPIKMKLYATPLSHFSRKVRILLDIMNGLDWLEAEFVQFNEITPGYLEFHLVWLRQHLDYYKLLPLAHPHLKKVVLSVLKNQRIAATSPFELKPL